MAQVYKVIYNVVDKDIASKNYGYMTEKVLKFKSYAEADYNQRIIANTTPNLVGLPVLVLTGE
jgi:hypothetical protein